VGANLAVHLKQDQPDTQIVCLDNLHRRGSELNLERLRSAGISFVHGDIRCREDLELVGYFDLLLECSAEPSVLSGYDGSPEYLIQTNLGGTVNCLEACRKHGAAILFLSTSRVYPMEVIRRLAYRETDSRLVLEKNAGVSGVSKEGFSEKFPMEGARSLYGATKLCSEILIREYLEAYGLLGVINRCGVITGPWQMGKVEQGFVVLWMARHFWGKSLSYIGFGGMGKQVRDILHTEDLYDLVAYQMTHLRELNGSVFNVGGGQSLSLSLRELTDRCRELTGNEIPIGSVPEDREADIPYYVSDCRRVRDLTGWKPKRDIIWTLRDILEWLRDNEKVLKPILGA